MRKAIIVLMCVWGLGLSVHAQETQVSYPMIGKQCPDFTLERVRNFSSSTVSLADLRGRFVVLDFWHRYCTACIRSFPKMNQLAQEFGDQIVFFMVGLEDEIGLDGLYQELHERYNLKMAATQDSALFSRFVPGRAAPHIILIDTASVVRAITNSLDSEMLHNFVSGRPMSFSDRSYDAISGSKPDNYSLLHFEDRENSRMVTILEEYDPISMPQIVRPISIYDRVTRQGKKSFEAVLPLRDLYKMAYFGHIGWLFSDPQYSELWPEPILEIADSTLFDTDYRLRNLFSYYLRFDHDWNVPSIMAEMQRNLHNAFGWQARVEWREMPCWNISVDAGTMEKIGSQGGVTWWDSQTDASVQSFTNFPFANAMNYVFNNCYVDTYPIIIEDSMKDVRVDFVLKDGLGLDFEILRAKLAEIGIIVKKGMKRMQVLVIGNS